MCAAVLTLEAITLGLTVPVMITIAEVSPAVAVPVGLGLALVCVLAAGMLRTPRGYAIGWAVQVAAVGLGFVIGVMFFLGGVFAALWATADWLGRKIERERADAFAAYDAEQAGGA
jgi:high-affinity Fe2+/Pb2+ permease